MGLLVKRDSSGYGNLPPMCPTFQPGPRFEWRYTVPAHTMVPQLYHEALFHFDLLMSKIAQGTA
jgi:hypothetical protein